MQYSLIKQKILQLFSDDTSELTPEQELQVIKTRFVAQSRSKNVTYCRIIDIQRSLQLMGIDLQDIRSLRVNQIDAIAVHTPDGYSSANIRIASSLHWNRLSSFFRSRGNIDVFSRYLATALVRNSERTISKLMETNHTTNENLIKLISKEKDVRALWRERMATPHEADVAIETLRNELGFDLWSQKFKFAGSVGGVEAEKGKRNSTWIIKLFKKHQSKMLVKHGADMPEKKTTVNSVDVGSIPGECDTDRALMNNPNQDSITGSQSNESGSATLDMEKKHGSKTDADNDNISTSDRHNGERELANNSEEHTKKHQSTNDVDKKSRQQRESNSNNVHYARNFMRRIKDKKKSKSAEKATDKKSAPYLNTRAMKAKQNQEKKEK